MRDLAIVLEIVREIDGRHAARAELALDAIAVGERAAEPLGIGRQRLHQDGRAERGIASRVGKAGANAAEGAQLTCRADLDIASEIGVRLELRSFDSRCVRTMKFESDPNFPISLLHSHIHHRLLVSLGRPSKCRNAVLQRQRSRRARSKLEVIDLSRVDTICAGRIVACDAGSVMPSRASARH